MHRADKAALRLAIGLGLAVLVAYGLALPAPFVVCVFAGAAAYILMHDVHNRHHFTAGLNYRAPDRTKVDKVFEVKLAVADRKRRQMKTWWTDTVPAIEITPVDGGEAAQFVSSEIKKEWYIARYRAAKPGLYHLSVNAPIPGDTSDAPPAVAEATKDIVVR